MEDRKITLVMMAGLPGSGKTTLACALKHEFGWRVIDKDEHRVELITNGWDEDYAANAAYDYSFNEIRTALVEQRISVILDTAALHLFILDTVKEIVKDAADVQLKVILCVVDRDLRNERLRLREGQYTRITLDPINITDYLRYFDHLPDNKLIIYTNVPITQCVDVIKKYVLS